MEMNAEKSETMPPFLEKAMRKEETPDAWIGRRDAPERMCIGRMPNDRMQQ